MKNRFLCLAAISFSIILLTLPAAASSAKAGFKPTVALRLFGGLGYQAIGDLNTGLNRPFPYVFISETLPSQPWQVNPRKATLDLSGFSIVAGFAFRF